MPAKRWYATERYSSPPAEISPQRYDRELVAKTLEAIERINEIRKRHERVFYKKRTTGKRAQEVSATRLILVAENEHLLLRLLR